MKRMPHLAAILSLSLAAALPAASAWAEPAAAPAAGPQIHIDVPVTINKAKIVFNMDHAAFNGDTPVGIRHMTLVLKRFTQPGNELDMIGVFHGDAGYMLLNDESYNKVRKTTTGNPYKGMIDELLKGGVKIEECGVTMKGNNWGNDNLLPGVKVNAGANLRIIELEQQGYNMLQP